MILCVCVCVCDCVNTYVSNEVSSRSCNIATRRRKERTNVGRKSQTVGRYHEVFYIDVKMTESVQYSVYINCLGKEIKS